MIVASPTTVTEISPSEPLMQARGVSRDILDFTSLAPVGRDPVRGGGRLKVATGVKISFSANAFLYINHPELCPYGCGDQLARLNWDVFLADNDEIAEQTGQHKTTSEYVGSYSPEPSPSRQAGC